VVLAARSDEERASRDALAMLCETYWRPVYAFLRSRGHDVDAARDLTQGFFADLLERRGLEAARRERGRFRHFLLASVKNYLSHERERAQAHKRGGGRAPFRLDADPGDESGPGGFEPVATGTPETIFEQRWATTLLDRTTHDLEDEMTRSGRGARFAALRPFLVSDSNPPYPELARELEMNETAVRVALHRMRQRFGVLLRGRVAETVEDESKVEDELRYLIGLVG
jgi:RNA polymerase sigma-70 factor (ECF subfamily)